MRSFLFLLAQIEPSGTSGLSQDDWIAVAGFVFVAVPLVTFLIRHELVADFRAYWNFLKRVWRWLIARVHGGVAAEDHWREGEYPINDEALRNKLRKNTTPPITGR